MTADALDVIERNAGQHQQLVANRQQQLADDQQRPVRQGVQGVADRARQGVLEREHARIGRSAFDGRAD